MHNPLGQREEVITMIDDDGVVRKPSKEEAQRRLEILRRAYCAEKHIDPDKMSAIELADFHSLPVVEALLDLKYTNQRD